MMAGNGLAAHRVIWLGRIWSAVALVALLLSPFVSGALLDSMLAIFLLLLLAVSWKSGASSPYFRVWQIGIALLIFTLLASQLVAGDLAQAIAIFQTHVAYAICGLSIVFWLMPSYSQVESEWARDGLRIVALLVFLAGSFISLGPLGLPPAISLGATPLITLAYLILASHSYRALRSRNENASLAPHYIALATLLWLVGGGFLGAISIQPGFHQALRGTALESLQAWLAGWLLLSLALAFVNAAATSLRGDNQRVTGYVPLWLIAFGGSLAGILQACRGVAQVYLRQVSALDSAAENALLLPLSLIWLLCLLAAALGIVTYALGFWLRRPRIHVIES